MRKTISALLALSMCLSLCACGENTAATPVETEHVMTEEEVFAARILIEGAKSFPNPINTKVTNVWAWKWTVGGYAFTYELEIKNQYGNTETVYYGNIASFNDLSEETLSEVISEMKASRNLTALGSPTESHYFSENAISGMQLGEALDAASIEAYFLANYK